MNTPFDHQKHCNDLEDAERELNAIGKHTLAAAVSRARVIHIDMQGRIAAAQREALRIRRLHEAIESIARTVEDYVIKPSAPWIGVDLFPKEDGEI